MPKHLRTATIAWLLFTASPALAGQGTQTPPPAVAHDPSDTRLVVSPTARTLPRGDVSVTLLGILPLIQVGIVDRFSMGVGPFLVPVEGGRPPLVLMPKAQLFRGDRTQASIGALHLAGPDDSSVGLAYGVVTRGTSDAAVTAGIGWLYARDDDESGAVPAVIAGMERRLNPRWKVVGDAYIFNGGAWTSGAARLTRTRFTADFGLMIVVADGDFIAFPTILLGWRF